MIDHKTDDSKVDYLVDDAHLEDEVSMKSKPVTDLSPRVVRLARYLDRLSLAASYSILLIKPSTKDGRWIISVDKVEEMRKMEL